MSDYIKREDVYSAIDNYVNGENSIVAVIAKEISKEVFMIPAADVVERKEGKWITEDGKPLPYGVCFSVCSECGHSSPASGFSFCPSCGADMRKLPKEE